MKKTVLAFAFALAFAASAFAQDFPMPKIFKGMEKQKGQYQVEMLEGGRATKDGRQGKPPAMTICTDNLMKPPAAGKGAPKDESGCKHRLLKDTADEAVMETTCPDRKSTMTMKREGGKTVMMDIASTGKSGKPENVKIRYTHLGPCREGQGTISLDKDSDQCRQIKQQAAKMDPVKQCAGAGDNRAMCEKQMRDAVAQMSSMCN